MIYIPPKGMPAKDKKILEEIKGYEESYFAFDEPIPFCGLKLYPVAVRNYNAFLITSSCFTLNKNDDPEGITQTHLNYLLNKIQDPKEGQLWGYKFSKLLEMIFHLQNGYRCEQCGEFMSWGDYIKKLSEQKNNPVPNVVCDKCGGRLLPTIRYGTEEKTKKKKLIIDGHDISSKDFDILRRLALYQNLPDYRDDSWVHPEVRADQEAKQRLLAIKSGGATASLERKICCVSAKSCYKISDIFEMPMRKFQILFDAIDSAMTYEAQIVGKMTGMFSSKAPVDHWVYKKEKGLYDAATSMDEYASKIGQANGH